jgi:hypothetical protein
LRREQTARGTLNAKWHTHIVQSLDRLGEELLALRLSSLIKPVDDGVVLQAPSQVKPYQLSTRRNRDRRERIDTYRNEFGIPKDSNDVGERLHDLLLVVAVRLDDLEEVHLVHRLLDERSKDGKEGLDLGELIRAAGPVEGGHERGPGNGEDVNGRDAVLRLLQSEEAKRLKE